MGLPAIDNFDRDSSIPLSGSWATAGTLSQMQGANNHAYGTGADSAAYWTGDTFANDQYSQVAIYGIYQGVVLRGGATNCYFVIEYGDHVAIYKSLAGVLTHLGDITFTLANGDTLRANIVGTTIEVFLNGVSKGTQAAGSDIASGSAGIYAYGSGNGYVDDWEGGNVGAGGFTEDLLSTINAASSIQDVQTFLQNLSSVIQSQSAVIDTLLGAGEYIIDYLSESCFEGILDPLGTSNIDGNGQTFTGDGRPLDRCRFYVNPNGSPTGHVYAKLYEATAGFGYFSHPIGDPLAISDAIDVSTFPVDLTLLEFNFSTPYTPVNGTYYCLVLEWPDQGGIGSVNIGASDVPPDFHPGNHCYHTVIGGIWVGEHPLDIIFYAITLTAPGGGVYTEVLTSIAVSASTIIAIQTFVEIVSSQIQSASSLTAAQAYIQNLLSILESVSVVEAIQTYLAVLNSTAQSVSSITDFKGQIESIRSTAISSSSIQDFQTYLEIRSDFIQSVSSLVDRQTYLNILTSIGVVSTSFIDYQKYVETAQTVIVSSSAISDQILNANLEILLSTIQSASSVAEFQSYFHNLLSTLTSLSSIADQQNFVENLLTLIQTHSSITDQQTYINTIQAVIISSSSIQDFQTYLEIRSDFIQSVSSLIDRQAYLNILTSIGAVSTSLADYQKYIETAQTVIVSSSAISDQILSANLEILLSTIQSVASVAEFQSYFHNLISTLTSLSSIADRQVYVHNILTLVQSHVSIADIELYIQTLQDLIVSSSSVTESITLGEILVSTIQSSDSVTTVQTYFHSLLSTLVSLSSISDKQIYIHNLLTLVQSQVSISDIQTYIHELQTLITSSAGVIDFLVTPAAEYLLSTILSRAGVYDYLHKAGMAEAAIRFYMTPRQDFEFQKRNSELIMGQKSPSFILEKRGLS